MIQLDSSHPFDWDGNAEVNGEFLASLAKTLSLQPELESPLDASAVDADVALFDRQIPRFVSAFLEWDFGRPGRSYGVDPVPLTDVLRIRRTLREVPGLSLFLGEGFLPMFYIGEGVTLYVYLPKQSEPCADSFVVAVDLVTAGWHFIANSSMACRCSLNRLCRAVRLANQNVWAAVCRRFPGPEESDAFHREMLDWSATVWGRYAYLREVVPLMRRGRAFFGTLPGYSGLLTPVLWVHETWSVTTAIDMTWDELLRCLTVWDDSLSTKFPVHFFHPKLDDAHFVYDW